MKLLRDLKCFVGRHDWRIKTKEPSVVYWQCSHCGSTGKPIAAWIVDKDGHIEKARTE